MSLRSTCADLMNVIDSMSLTFPCRADYLTRDTEKMALKTFLEFIKRKTNWKVSSISFLTSSDQSVLIQNEPLFDKSVDYVGLVELKHTSSVSSLNNLLKWLERVALKANSKVELSIADPKESFPLIDMRLITSLFSLLSSLKVKSLHCSLDSNVIPSYPNIKSLC